MGPPKPLHRSEFVALMAMLFATIAFSVDSMLPALPEIADQLTPSAPNRAQLIVTSFVLGMGLGTLVTGPISDALGRKPVIVGGALLYVLGCGIAWRSESLELLLAARVLQGLGAAGPRIVAMAIIRDLYEGRRMARLMSFVMMVFALVPAIAPAMGAGIIALFGWRAIFIAFIMFSLASMLWLVVRQPETLPPKDRRPFRFKPLKEGITEVVSNRHVMISIAALTLVFAMLFTFLVTTQPVFDETFDMAESFPLWFALVAVISASGSVLNARVVIAFGMRRVAAVALLTQTGFSALTVLYGLFFGWETTLGFGIYIFWMTTVFFSVGLTIGNLNALAMTPMGHIAGMAASIIGAISTVFSLFIAVPLGLAFDGTPLPSAIGVTLCAAIAYLIVRSLEDGSPVSASDRA